MEYTVVQSDLYLRNCCMIISTLMSYNYNHACSITCVSSGNSCCHRNHVINCVYFMNFHIPLVQFILKQYYRVDPSSTGSKGAGLQDYTLRTSRFHSSTNLSYGSYIFGRRDITYTYYAVQYAVQRVKWLVLSICLSVCNKKKHQKRTF